MAIAISLHLLAAVLWVGGMFFAYIVLRPIAATLLEPPVRLTLWAQVFKRFFPWVWMAIIILLASGLWMVFAHFGGFSAVGIHVHTMIVLAVIMIVIFAHVYYGPYRHLHAAVATENWPAGGAKLNQIRKLIGINLILGLVIVVIASAGRYFS
ncbi:MAG: CopD family protein [Thiotrichales bacterium]|nr:CopD family protein [Thiotrichales bacterium]